MMKLHALRLVLAVSILAGCSTRAPSVVQPGSTPTFKRVGVVSVIADSFVRMYVGVTVFGNEREEKSIEDWHLDSAYESQLVIAASKVLGAQAAAVPGAGQTLKPLIGTFGLARNGLDIQAATSQLAAACSQGDFDALVIASKRVTGDIFKGTNQTVSGAGIYSRGDTSILHVLAFVTLYDCRSSRALATRWIIPSVPLEPSLARTPIAKWTPDFERELREKLTTLPSENWEDAIANMLR